MEWMEEARTIGWSLQGWAFKPCRCCGQDQINVITNQGQKIVPTCGCKGASKTQRKSRAYRLFKTRMGR